MSGPWGDEPDPPPPDDRYAPSNIAPITASKKRGGVNIARVLDVMRTDPVLSRFALDEMCGSVVWRTLPPWAQSGSGEMSDEDNTAIQEWFSRHHGMRPGTDLVARAVGLSALERRFNSCQDYLRGLRWDGMPRADSWLHRVFGADDTLINRAFASRWLIGAVARAMDPGCKMDCVLVLEGPQGARKSTCLDVLGGAWYSDDLGDVRDKDALVSLDGVWILEIAELEAMRQAEIARIKAWLSKRIDRYRPPYGRYKVRRPRRCVFAATTNEHHYLSDTTGNRRYWPVACTRADVDLLTAARDQLWAEAVARYDAGEPWWLTRTDPLWSAAEDAVEARRQIDPWEPILAADGRSEWTITSALMELDVPVKDRTRAHEMRISAILRAMGFVAGRGRPRVYRRE